MCAADGTKGLFFYVGAMLTSGNCVGGQLCTVRTHCSFFAIIKSLMIFTAVKSNHFAYNEFFSLSFFFTSSWESSGRIV